MNRTLEELIAYSHRAGWGDLSDRGTALLVVRINSTLQHLARLRPWPSYKVLGSFQLKAPYSTGIVIVNKGSATITGSGTTWTTGMAGQEFLGPDSRPYTIQAFVSATQLTLSQEYLGDSKAIGDAATYSIRYVRYAVPDRFDRAGRMYHRLYGWMGDGRDLADWIARRLEIHQESQAPDTVWKTDKYFYVDPSPSAADSIHYPYWQRPQRLVMNSDETDWPEKFDWLLYAALGLTVRERTEQDAAGTLYAPAFQAFVSTAYSQADASAEPMQLLAGRATAGMTRQEFQGQFQIAPDV